jgi:hypothetical protein
MSWFLGPRRDREIRHGAARLIALGWFRLGGILGFRRARWRGRRRLVVGQALAETASLGTIAAAALGAIGTLRALAVPLLNAGRRGARLAFSLLRVAAAAVVALASVVARTRLELTGLLMAVVVLGLHVGDVQKAVTADGEIDERGLNRRLEIDDLALVDVAGIALVASTLEVQLLKDAILDDGNSAFLGLEHVDQHFFLHASIFLIQAFLASFG